MLTWEHSFKGTIPSLPYVGHLNHNLASPFPETHPQTCKHSHTIAPEIEKS